MSVITPPESSPLAAPAVRVGAARFGLTVSRRQARRAVARNTVRRVLREAARLRAPALEAALGGAAMDVLFRLKCPLPEPAVAGWSGVKAQLRREADSLLDQLLGLLRSGEPAAMLAQAQSQGQRHSLAQSARGRGAAGRPAAAALPASSPVGVQK